MSLAPAHGWSRRGGGGEEERHCPDVWVFEADRRVGLMTPAMPDPALQRYDWRWLRSSESANQGWEVRVFAGRDALNRPVQTSRMVRGAKLDALRVAASVDCRPARNSADRTVAHLLNAWIEVDDEIRAEPSRRDQGGRVGS